MSTFSMNGSPTWTLGRLDGLVSSKVSDARIDAPPMPSPPVRAPNSTTLLPTPDALARWMSSCRSTPRHSALTSGLPWYEASNTSSPPMFGRPSELPYPPTPDTTPCTTRAVSGWSTAPNRSWSMTATGRAPIEMMSRTMPPTPVAAPWYGSTYDGWLCDSTLNVTAQPSPMSTTPAFSPMPTSRCSVISGVTRSPNLRRCTLLDLYEQCSDHMTEYMASSAAVGRRSRMSRIRWYSSGLRPSSANGCSWSGVAAAASTVSDTWPEVGSAGRCEAGVVLVIESLGLGARWRGGRGTGPAAAGGHRQ